MQKTAYEMRISDWSSDVCSSDLLGGFVGAIHRLAGVGRGDARLQRGGQARQCADQLDPASAAAQLLQYPGRIGAAGQEAGGQPGDDDPCRRPAFAPGGLERVRAHAGLQRAAVRSEEHTSELQSLMRISYAVFCLKKKT